MISVIYRCPIIGDGTDGDEFRPHIANYAVRWSIHGQFPDGESHCLVKVTASQEMHAVIAADPLVEIGNG